MAPMPSKTSLFALLSLPSPLFFPFLRSLTCPYLPSLSSGPERPQSPPETKGDKGRRREGSSDKGA